ncbi:hypothetical protein FACS1894122_04830 [Alphaproteobacteria bacterium]|nr:hypothetical protein FACS1894122_04830 [Alphaproteobacteria bacterium]
MIDEEKLEQISAKKLAGIILAIYMKNRNLHREIELLVAGSSCDEKEIISIIKKRISALSKSRGLIDDLKIKEVVSQLDEICDSIFNLSDFAAKEAFDLMGKFFECRRSIFKRCVYNEDEILASFGEACLVWGKIAERANIKSTEAVKTVFTLYSEDTFGATNKIIRGFANVLGKDGLESLKTKIRNMFSDNSIKALAAQMEKERTDDDDEDDAMFALKELGISVFMSNGGKRFFKLPPKNLLDRAKNVTLKKIQFGLSEIADYQNNVDEYILAQAFPKTTYDYDDVGVDHKKEIAERLISANRGEEALQWLAEIKNPRFSDESKVKTLRINALEQCGRAKEAQKERIYWFKATLDHNAFLETIKHEQKALQKQLAEELIDWTMDHDKIYLAMHFLSKNLSLDKCSSLVESRIAKINGECYWDLHPVAESLQKDYPLSATLLYRKVIEYVLKGAISKKYGIGAKDLVLCEQLSSRISDFKRFPAHSNFMEVIREKHKRKEAFWTRFEEEKKKLKKKKSKA